MCLKDKNERRETEFYKKCLSASLRLFVTKRQYYFMTNFLPS